MQPPTDWPERQRDFRSRYEHDRSGLPRHDVYWRLLPGERVWSGLGIFAILLPLAWLVNRLRQRRMFNESPLLAAWPVDARPGSEVTVIFEVAPSPSGREGHGVLVGEMAPNGALCVEVDGGPVLWPVYNPRQPLRAPPRR